MHQTIKYGESYNLGVDILWIIHVSIEDDTKFKLQDFVSELKAP